jgi:tRNA1Val (adenine37-N6)-methyltransferase
MPKNYFQFKKFKIYQDKCSMKVCTDACIFGAFVAEKVSCSLLPDAGCLEVGAGTGLLSLMYAQKNPNATIDAVEIEENAYKQAKENFALSNWNDRLKIFHTDAKNFVSHKKYDLIISNPPFYENESSSKEKNKNVAKHDEGLTLKDLISIIKTHLATTGSFAVLLPYHRIKYFESLVRENNFFLKEKLLVRQTPAHNFFRGILFFSNYKTDLVAKELTIKNKNSYTEEFMALLKDYYLKL